MKRITFKEVVRTYCDWCGEEITESGWHSISREEYHVDLHSNCVERWKVVKTNIDRLNEKK